MRRSRPRFRACSVVPANSDLVGLESDLGNDQAALSSCATPSLRLRRNCARKPVDEQFGYVLIDCPPSLNILTLNAMAAANAVLVPVQCEFFALEGISQLKETIDQIRATLNPTPGDPGRGSDHARCPHDAFARGCGRSPGLLRPKVYESVIPRNTRVAEAPSHGKPILLYDYDCAGSQAYIRLATEIIERERQNKAA